MTSRGFSIRIFLPDGRPDGIRVVEKSNWTGRGLVCPRALFPAAKSRTEFGRTGVYVLTAPADDTGQPTLYIGEGDPVRARLEQHYAKKDFWTAAILFTSKDENLNKAHVQYLESRLIALAQEAKRCGLENGNTPQLPSLSEADCAEMETFLEEMRLIFPVLGISAFERPVATPASGDVLRLKGKGLESRGHESGQGFIVRKGSKAAIGTAPSCHRHLIDLRKALEERGILVRKADHFELAQDYTFDSPSTAAGVMLGRSSNGRREWKDGKGRSLKELQAAAAGGEA